MKILILDNKIFRKIPFFICLTLFSCSENQSHKNYDLKGNWSVLKTDSTYFEWYVDSSFIYSYSIMTGPLFEEKYKIQKDTLVIMQKNTDREIKSLIIQNKFNKNLKLFNLISKETLYISRINTQNFNFNDVEDKKDIFKYNLYFKNRENKLKGINWQYNIDSILCIKNIDTVSIEKLN